MIRSLGIDSLGSFYVLNRESNGNDWLNILSFDDGISIELLTLTDRDEQYWH